MRLYLEYTFYRLAKLYKKYPTDQGSKALVMIALAETCIILAAVNCIGILLGKKGAETLIAFFKWIIVIVVCGTFYLNFQVFKNRYQEFDERWGNEQKHKRIRNGVLIAICLIMSIIIFAKVTESLYHVAKN